MEVLYWFLVGLVFYTYVGYGLLLYIVLKIRSLWFSRTISYPKRWPEVTLVVPAYNEEEVIRAKAENSLALNYPKDLLRILFITDGSTDNTYEILKALQGVEVAHKEGRAGKAAAENRSLKLIKSPIVIFSDANTMVEKESIRELVKFYQDKKVGGVAGAKKVISGKSENASGAGEGIYWKYESQLKKWDSDLYTVVGAAGELVSFRTECLEEIEEDSILDDFMQSMRICEKGYVVKYEPKAIAVETASANVSEELKRKIRIAAGGWQSMSRLPKALNPFRNFILTFQYVSHRVLRWSAAPLALPLIFILNFFLLTEEPVVLYHTTLLLQVVFYALALLGWVLQNRNVRLRGLYVPYYFFIMNYAVFAGFFRWLGNKQKATWEKAKRAEV